jgi:2-keto-4-pentenoate hydratase/2-oxohepta-3-ene-1,7-dioic acid hydratase in catechol pathway
MKLATFRRAGTAPRPAVLAGEEALVELPQTDMLAFLEAGDEAMERARELAAAPPAESLAALDSVTLLAPIPRPASIRDCMTFEKHVINSTRAIGLGRYARVDRVVERLLGRRFSLAHRVNRTFFEQPPYYKSNPRSVVGPDAEVRIPAYSQQFDYELEWGVVIGRQGVDIPAERAREHIAGYTIFNDFSARDAQKREMGGHLGPAKGKDFDTGNAIGPWMVTPDELPEPYDLAMVARVHGAEWSRGSTAEMTWKFEDLIAHISASETLYPGDFIGSGTVGMGCGLEHGAFLQPGDVVELEVEGIGVLRNRVVAAAEAA